MAAIIPVHSLDYYGIDTVQISEEEPLEDVDVRQRNNQWRRKTT